MPLAGHCGTVRVYHSIVCGRCKQPRLFDVGAQFAMPLAGHSELLKGQTLAVVKRVRLRQRWSDAA